MLSSITESKVEWRACCMHFTSMTIAMLVLSGMISPMRAHAGIGGDDIKAETEEIGPEKLNIIQNRKYELGNELLLQMGVLPGDPYYKGLTGSVGYAIHFTDFFAWEVAQFTYSLNFNAPLQRAVAGIARRGGGDLPAFPEIQWMVRSHAVLKPIYGKQALFNTTIVHVEAYVQFGPAMLRIQDIKRENGVSKDTFSFGADVGAGLRFWTNKTVSWRFDFGNVIYLVPSRTGRGLTVKQAMQLNVGVAFNLRGDE